MSLRFRLVRVRDNREPPVYGLYRCRQCGWVFVHPETDRWSNTFITGDQKLFRPLDELKYSTWEEWCDDYSDCVRGLTRITG